MIDLAMFEEFLLKPAEGWVDGRDKITLEFQAFLLRTEFSSKRTKIASIFKFNQVYTVETRCICGIIFESKHTKRKMLEQIGITKGYTEIRCPSCIRVQKEESKKISIGCAAKNAEVLSRNTESFIFHFLDPNKKWTTKSLKQAFWDMLSHYQSSNSEPIKKYIKSLDYYDFLKTPYWAAVAYRLKAYSGFKCSLCSSSENLRAHHNTYSNHGNEIETYKDDLICLCENCHSTFHSEREVAQ